MEEEYREASREELDARLRRLREDLKDLEDTFSFNLANTAAHLNAGMVNEHEQELEEYREKIAHIEEILRKKA
jgi:archaellum component FlaC